MENASKALVIAGGILLSVLLLSLGVLGYTKIKSFKTTESESVVKKQKEAFNAEYESYNRQLLYGIDVISVVNKAIDNNIQQEQSDGDPWYINVIVDLQEDFYSRVEKIDETSFANVKRTILTKSEVNNLKNTYTEIKILAKGRRNLGTLDNKGEIKMNSDIINFFNETDKETEQTAGKITYKISSPLKSFKSAIFICTNIEYNGDGRVSQITFKEK